ncbi:hypothetical protein L3V79_05495 [Thiotrichales bacterium 19S9-12]|nr:hypothetical protein [Thiotrichales bacterium 19S9-11]MCF6811813.1 hypothetical protein [Thiotrichales bacterium 19S9-12]
MSNAYLFFNEVSKNLEAFINSQGEKAFIKQLKTSKETKAKYQYMPDDRVINAYKDSIYVGVYENLIQNDAELATFGGAKNNINHQLLMNEKYTSLTVNYSESFDKFSSLVADKSPASVANSFFSSQQYANITNFITNKVRIDFDESEEVSLNNVQNINADFATSSSSSHQAPPSHFQQTKEKFKEKFHQVTNKFKAPGE